MLNPFFTPTHAKGTVLSLSHIILYHRFDRLNEQRERNFYKYLTIATAVMNSPFLGFITVSGSSSSLENCKDIHAYIESLRIPLLLKGVAL